MLVVFTVVFAFLASDVLFFGGGTGRTTSTYITTSTIIGGTTTVTVFPPGKLYDVTYKEGGQCGGHIDQWGVQLGNLTITQPPDIQPYQISESGFNATGRFDLTTIVFSVPSGTYPFTVYPTSFLRLPLNNTSVGDIRDSSGTVTVTDANVTIDTISTAPSMAGPCG